MHNPPETVIIEGQLYVATPVKEWEKEQADLLRLQAYLLGQDAWKPGQSVPMAAIELLTLIDGKVRAVERGLNDLRNSQRVLLELTELGILDEHKGLS